MFVWIYHLLGSSQVIWTNKEINKTSSMSSYECNSVLVTDIQCTNSREWSSLQRKYESQSVWSNTVLKVSVPHPSTDIIRYTLTIRSVPHHQQYFWQRSWANLLTENSKCECTNLCVYLYGGFCVLGLYSLSHHAVNHQLCIDSLMSIHQQ